jgi:hypothetical protein
VDDATEWPSVFEGRQPALDSRAVGKSVDHVAYAATKHSSQTDQVMTLARWERKGSDACVLRLLAGLKACAACNSVTADNRSSRRADKKMPGRNRANRTSNAMASIPERKPADNNFRASDPVDWKRIAGEAWEAPGWREAAADYHKNRDGRRGIVEIEPERLARLRRLMDDDVLLERAWGELNRAHRTEASQSTTEALVYELRRYGLTALEHPNCLRRLSDLGDEQLRDVMVRVQKFNPEIAQPWTPEDVEILLAVRGRVHGQ